MKVSTFKNYVTIPMLAVMAASSIAATAGNQSQSAVIERPDGSRSVRVSYADLNLQADTGVETLNRRIKQAAKIVCGISYGQGLHEHSGARKCYRKSMAQATDAVKVAVSRVRSGPQLASAQR